MAGILSGLEAFGLGKLSKMEVYEKEEEKAKKSAEPEVVHHTVSETELIFDKSYTCPVCDKMFKAKNVKAGKVKLNSMDSDLRPKYQSMDSLKYDAVVCPNCGYAALNRFFNYMTSVQAKLIKESISANFRGLPQEGEVYSYDDAIARHKLALVNTIVKRSKLSEKAYTCLKTAWLLRGKNETLPAETPDYVNVKKALQEEEMECLKNAYEGFQEVFSKEMFPMCGMDENTCTYLVGELARRLGHYDEASRWISRVLTARDANERIKAKAREAKELITAALKAKQ